MAYTHIEDGFVRPLGPYIAQEILDNAAVRRIQKDKLYLESVSFRQGANQVGYIPQYSIPIKIHSHKLPHR